jgi:glutamyl-Q tRNA(Asp) synthetase
MIIASLPERTRFAPSPTGYLHLGHALAAISAYEAAAPTQFLVRIEDLDTCRSREEFIAAMLDDLHWLGLQWQEPVVRQSSRHEAYRAALGRLERRGLLYPCFCTRREIADEIARSVEAPHGLAHEALYPGTCRGLTVERRAQKLTQGRSFALRLDMEKAIASSPALQFQELGTGPHAECGTVSVNPALFGDVVLARKDLPAAYHLAVVVDDAFQGVTLVTRAHDLFAATHLQRLLQHLLGLPAPRYAHHRLLLDATGKKFSKRDQAVTLRTLRREGITPTQVRARVGLTSR